MNQLLTVKQVQEYLNISRSATYNLLNSKMIPIIRIGTAIRVDEKDLEDYIKKEKSKITK